MVTEEPTIADLIGLIAERFEPIDNSVDETGMTIVLAGQVVRIDFRPIPPRPTRRDTVEAYDRLANAIRDYDDARRAS